MGLKNAFQEISIFLFLLFFLKSDRHILKKMVISYK